MAGPGWFDSTVAPEGWFDDSIQPGGWFDSSLLTIAAAPRVRISWIELELDTGGGGITGSIADTQAPNTDALTGAVDLAGTLSGAQAANSCSATGTVALAGSIADSQAANTDSLTGAVALAGSIDDVQAANTDSLTGTVATVSIGELASTQAPNTDSLTGTASIAGYTPDADFALYQLLLHGEGADNGTVITDSSNFARTPTVTGNARTRTTEFKFGASSIYFDGAGDYLTYTGLPSITGDFILDLWYRPDSVTAGQGRVLFDNRVGAADVNGFALFAFGTGVNIFSNNATQLTSSVTLVAGAWHRIAVRRISGVVTLIVNTVESAGWATAAAFSRARAVFGRDDPGNTQFLAGYLDEIRLKVGDGEPNRSFASLPTTPYPDIKARQAAGTGAATGAVAVASIPDDPTFNLNTLLLHGEGTNGAQTFVDSSINNRTPTVTGNVNTSTAWARFGTASMYFDGAGDYLTFNSTPTIPGEFVIDCWIVPDTVSGSHVIFDNRFTFNTALGFALYQSGATIAVFSNNVTQIVSGNVLTAGVPAYIRLRRVGTSIKLEVDGAAAGSLWTSATNFNLGKIVIGRDDPGNINFFAGYIDEFRVKIGDGEGAKDGTVPTRQYDDTATQVQVPAKNTCSMTGSVGAVGVSGPLASTQAPNTDSLTGAVDTSGAQASTQAANTDALTGAVALAGSIASTQQPNTDVLTGANAIAGSMASTQAANTGSMSGAIGSVSTGSIASTQNPNTDALTGAVSIAGSGAGSERAGTSSATGTATISGSSAGAQARGTGAATGAVSLAGSIADTQARGTAAASGAVGFVSIGSMDSTQGRCSSAMSGTVGVSGSASDTQRSGTGAGTGAVALAGSAAGTNRGSGSGTGAVLVSGSAASTQAHSDAAAFGLVLNAIIAGLARVYRVAEDDRTLIVSADDRTYAVDADDRTYRVPADARVTVTS